MTDTAIGAALARAGMQVRRHHMQAAMACIAFINAGGTLEEWIEVYKLTSMRPRPEPAPTPRPQSSSLPSPRRHTPADLAARASARRATAKAQLSVFDKYRTHDGRLWAKVAYNELSDMSQDGDAADLFMQHIGPLSGKDRHKLIDELVAPSDFAQIMRKADIRANP
jgi:hypothetical protein